jgi:lysozyme family protein
MIVEPLIDAVIEKEGGYVNHPADRGGPTCWGITQQVARAYGYTGDMKVLPRSTAAEIYRKRYWTAVGFDQVGAVVPALAAEMFDIGVNMGPAVAGRFLQRAVNLLNRGASDYPDVVVDGGIGALTIAALKGYRKARPDAEGVAVLVWMVRAFRTGRYAEIAEANPSQEVFEYGWVARQVRAA